MTYYIAQSFGIVAMILSAIMPLPKKKWKMLAICFFVNIFVILNYLLLDGITSGVVLNTIGNIQIIVSLIHIKTNTKATTIENIVFFIAYVACGLFSYAGPIDLIPIVAVIFFMLAVFAKDMKTTRFLNIGNALSWIIYSLLVGATAFLSPTLALVSNIVGLVKDRKD